MKRSSSQLFYFAALIFSISLFSHLSSLPSLVSAACSLAERNNASAIAGGLPRCIKVGFLSPTPNADGTPLTDTQKYWAITLPQRVWKNVKLALTVRGVVIEEVQTSLNWAGALNATQNGTYDVFVSNFWMLASRSRRVDFLIPYLRENWLLLYKTPPVPGSSPVVNWADPFTFEVWMTAISVVVAGGVCLCIAEIINHGWNGEHHQHILRPDEELKDDPFMMLRDADVGAYFEGARNALSHALGAIFGTYDVVPRSFGGWMTSWALHWFIFVFFASYTANLATFLSLRKTALPRSETELFSLPVITVPEPEIMTMIREKTPTKMVQTFTNNVGGYLAGFLSSNADSAALPELDVKEILLNRCDLSATSTELSIESSFIFRQQDSIYAAKQIIDEAMLQFADFGILAKWVDSGLPADSCERGTSLANAGAMGIDELGGAFIVALVLFGVAICVAIWTLVREKWMHRHVIEKFGAGGPHRSDDTDLVGDIVGSCQTTVNDAKRSAAALVELLSERTSEVPLKYEKARKADWDSFNVQPALDNGISGELHTSLLLFLHDGIVTQTPEDEQDDDLTSDDEERRLDAEIKRSNEANSIAREISRDERQRKTQVSAKHLAKIRGGVTAAASALHLAEDAINRSGRRRYCILPIQNCNSRMGHPDPERPIEEDSTETHQQFVDRTTRERLHIDQLLEVARGATKSAAAAAEAAEVALLSSTMQRGRRRRIIEKWMTRAFRAAAFLTLLIASAARRVSNESSYVSKAYLEREHEALDELAELAALTANEVEQIVRSLREEEEDALASPHGATATATTTTSTSTAAAATTIRPGDDGDVGVAGGGGDSGKNIASKQARFLNKTLTNQSMVYAGPKRESNDGENFANCHQRQRQELVSMKSSSDSVLIKRQQEQQEDHQSQWRTPVDKPSRNCKQIVVRGTPASGDGGFNTHSHHNSYNSQDDPSTANVGNPRSFVRNSTPSSIRLNPSPHSRQPSGSTPTFLGNENFNDQQKPFRLTPMKMSDY